MFKRLFTAIFDSLPFKKAEALNFREERANIEADHRLAAILDQIELYFSDSNLDNDEGLRELINRSGNRFVSAEILAEWPKLKRFRTNAKEILYLAERSAMLETNTKKMQIRSRIPYSEDEERLRKTVRISGFDKSMNLLDIHDYIHSISDDSTKRITMVRHLRYEKMMFSGTVLVELDTVQEADDLIKRAKECEGHLLEAKTMEEHKNHLPKPKVPLPSSPEVGEKTDFKVSPRRSPRRMANIKA